MLKLDLGKEDNTAGDGLQPEKIFQPHHIHEYTETFQEDCTGDPFFSGLFCVMLCDLRRADNSWEQLLRACVRESLGRSDVLLDGHSSRTPWKRT